MQTHLVTPIKRKRLFETVSEELAELILAGQIAAGTKLPSEHELAAQFGVSRNVVREGVRSLIQQGLVTVRAGDGIYVRVPDERTVVDAFSRYMLMNRGQNWLEELYEVRRQLEPAIAALAAERATAEDLQALEAALERMGAHTDDGREWASADWSFHRALARATQNSLFPLLLNPLYSQILVAFEEGWRYPRAYESGLRYHREILEAVRSRQPEVAREGMLAHLEQSFSEVSEAFHQRAAARSRSATAK